MSLFRRIIYNRNINFILTNLFWPLRKLLPEKFKIPINGIIKVNLGDKEINFTANETSPMLRELFWNYYRCDFEFSVIIVELVKSSKVFFDIGANIGYYSLITAKANPELKIFSFEPSNGPFYFLKKNIELNKLSNIKAFKYAVGAENCDITFYEDINPKYKYQKYHVSGTGNTANTWNNDSINKYSIDCIKIDSFILNEKIDTVDLMKIDTEGTEDKVLLGAMESIIKFKPIIICEVLPNKIEDNIFKIIKSIDYLIFQHNEDEQNLMLVEKFNLLSRDRNFIFIPESKLYLINKFIK